MKIKTALFGEMEVADDLTYRFSEGLYGLESYHEFVLIRPDVTVPFAYLQAVDEQEICLLVADPFAFYPAYEFDLQDEDVEAMSNPKPDQISTWATVTTKKEFRDATMNLMAPIVLNEACRIGKQVVLHQNDYSIQTPMFPRVKKGEI